MLGIPITMMSNAFIDEYTASQGYEGNYYKMAVRHMKASRDSKQSTLTPHQLSLVKQSYNSPTVKRKSKTFNSDVTALIIDFNNMTDEELDTYGNVFSKNINESKERTVQKILQIKNKGNKYMSTEELLQELRRKQAQNTSIDVKQAVGELYKRNISGSGNLSAEVKQVLNINDDRGILPKIVRERIVLDYPSNNPLREIMTVTTDDKLRELPVMKYSGINGLELKGESIALQPIHERILASVSETVVLGSKTNLTETIEAAMFSELYSREVKNIFATDPDQGKEHMSLYHNDIDVVKGANIYEAIDNALKDLPQAIRDNSSIVISLEDYQDVVRHLGTIGLGGLAANPDMIWNKKLVIIDQATKPVIGDFELLHANYEQLAFGTGKDVKKGIYTVALRLVNDIRVVLPKAFRIAEVEGK